MRELISRDSASPRELAEATGRLERALEQLEAACAATGSPSTLSLPSTGALDEAAYAALESDRARLAADLGAAHARECELAAAAAAASLALGRAAEEVRAALNDGVADEGEDASKPDGGGLSEEAA